MLDSILESIQVVALPTKTSFRSVDTREVLLIQGPQGWGEFSPFVEYTPRECVPWLVSAIESAYVSPPTKIRGWIPVNATMPAVNGEQDIAEVLSWFPGCTSVKVKVGIDTAQDLARIGIIRQLIPNAKIRLDVNGNWSVEQALEILEKVSELGSIEFVEQPCATESELRELKNLLSTPILIAGDEIIRKSSDPIALNLDAVIDIVALKVAPLGGIKNCLNIAKHFQKPVVVSSALDSAVGISYGLKLASTLSQLPYACGLATGALLAIDLYELPIVNGAIKVNSMSPNPQILSECAVSGNRLDWWRDRVRQTWSAGADKWVTKEGWLS